MEKKVIKINSSETNENPKGETVLDVSANYLPREKPLRNKVWEGTLTDNRTQIEI